MLHADHSSFQAAQIQLEGPVPAELYHRYVEFKPFVAGMFTSHSLRGRILNRALHHQHARIYNYDRSTIYGLYPKPTIEMTRKFLEFVHYDQGGRIFTYVLTLDAQWRFTETGKEFGIDMLSKHTMHSDVSIYIAFSGEFFIRKLKHPHADQTESSEYAAAIMPPAPEPENPERPEEAEPHKGPEHFELLIDNDSGTYRPNAKYLPKLKEFISHNLPGLRVVTLDCGADEEKMKKLKDEQREKKKNTGKQINYQQNTRTSSLSGSDEEGQMNGADGGPVPKKKLSGFADIKAAKDGLKHGDDIGGDGEEPERESGSNNIGSSTMIEGHDDEHVPSSDQKETQNSGSQDQEPEMNEKDHDRSTGQPQPPSRSVHEQVSE